MKTQDDLATLVERARAGDPRAFDTLVRRFQNASVGYARSVLGGDPAAAEDAVQEAFVEAHRCLPTLRDPRAFPAWLRRIVFKHCDRIRRTAPRVETLLVPETAAAADALDPARVALAGERAARIRAAIASLPNAEREVVALFYLADNSHAAIAAFLGVPATTVKSRLHAARKQLRRDLLDLMDISPEVAPQKSARADSEDALARIVTEYERQFHDDPKTADRSLLAGARERLDAALARPPLAPETVRVGRGLLERQRDFDALAQMLVHYRAQNLSVSEETWTRWWHVWALTCANRADETIAEQADFCRWADATFARETPCLADGWPFEPLGDVGTGEMIDASELPLWVLGVPGQVHLWNQAGHADEWMRLAEAALSQAGRTPANRLNRFHLLRSIGMLYLAPAGRLNDAEATIARIAEIADEETDPAASERWRLEERTTMMAHHAVQHNDATVRAVGEEVTARLAALERHFDASGERPPWWLRTFQHNAACSLAGARAYDIALPLFETVTAGGRANGYAYLRMASAVWAGTRDRDRTLDLLREAAAREDRDMLPLLRDLPEFADVRDDPEFVAAARKPQP